MATRPKLDVPLIAPQDSNPGDVQYATDAINAEYIPQENAIDRALEILTQTSERDISAQQKYGAVADEKMGQIGEQLAATLTGGVAATKDIFNQGIGNVGKYYDEASGVQAGSDRASISGIDAVAGGLGHGAAGDSVLARLQQEGSNIQARAAGNKAASKSNLETLSAQLQAIGQAAVGDSQRNSAQKREDLATQVLDNITEIQKRTGEETGDLMAKFVSLAQTKSAKFRNLLADVAKARTQQEHDNAMDALTMQIKQQKHSADMANISSQIAKRGTDSDIAVAKFASSEQTKADKAKTEAKDKAKNVTYSKGHQGLTSWMRNYWKDPKTGGQVKGAGPQKGAIRDFIAGIETSSAESKSMGDTSSSFDRAMAETKKYLESTGGAYVPYARPDGSIAKVDPQVWYNAIRTYFQGSGGAKYGSK